MNIIQRERVSTIAGLVIILAVAALALISLQPRTTDTRTTGAPLRQGNYTVVMENDSSSPVTLTVWATYDVTNTIQALGLITVGESITITLPSGKETYTFDAVADMPGGLGYHSSVMSEQRLIDRSYHVKLLEDDMQFAAVPVTRLPPTPTYEPVVTPTP